MDNTYQSDVYLYDHTKKSILVTIRRKKKTIGQIALGIVNTPF